MSDQMDRIPMQLRGALRATMQANKKLDIYEICHLFEPSVDRKTYHCLLKWAESVSEARKKHKKIKKIQKKLNAYIALESLTETRKHTP